MPVDLSGAPLVNPADLIADLTAAGLPVGPWAAKCHSFVSPAEREAGVGHVLVRRADWDRIADKTRLTLTFTGADGRSVSFRQLHVASGPTPLAQEYRPADPVLWLTLEDRRSRFTMVAVKRAYNLRLAGGGWDAGTLNAGTPWTWAGVLGDLWAKLKAVYSDLPSSAPTLPSTPSGTPESFAFYGDDAWTSFCDVAQAGGLLAVFDPTADDGGATGPVSLIDPAATPDAEPDAAVGARTWDTGAFLALPEAVPAAVTVSYHRIGRTDSHQVDAAISETGTTASAAVVLPAYPAAAGDPVSNTTYLTAFAGRVRDFWRRDWAARTEPRAVQYRGWQAWPKAAVGRGGWARWGVSELANDEVQTSAATGPLLRLDPGEVWLGGGCCEADRLTDVCLVYDGYGAVVGLRKTFTREDGSTYCEDATACPEDGCSTVWYCTPDGPVDVTVGADPPDGWTAGPFRSYEEAITQCPPEPPPLEPVSDSCSDVLCSMPLPNTYYLVDLEIFDRGGTAFNCGGGFSATGWVLYPTYSGGGTNCVTGYAMSTLWITPPYGPEPHLDPADPGSNTGWGITLGYPLTGSNFQFGFIDPTADCSGSDIVSGAELAECAVNCDGDGFLNAVYCWAQTSNWGRFRIYRQGTTPPAFCPCTDGVTTGGCGSC